jgi:hypothetical protein
MYSALMRSAADILLELLNHADGTTLEVLLHPPNLQTLVERAGYDEEALRGAQSMQPGERLLALFHRGAKAADLMAQLSPEAIAAARAAGGGGTTSPAAGRRRRPVLPLLRPAHWVGLTLILAVGLVPSLLMGLDLRAALWVLLNKELLLVVGAAAGALGGVLLAQGRARWWIGALGGGLAAPGALAALLWYLISGPGQRPSVFALELVLVSMVGMAPGGLVAFFLRRRVKST